MSDTPSNSSEQNYCDDLRAGFAEYFRRLLEKHGARESEKFRDWSVYRMHLLRDFNVQQDVDKLTSCGVAIQTIGISTLLINIAPGFDYFVKQYFGDRKTRAEKAERLAAAIPIVREFAELQKGVYKETPEEFFKTWEQPHPESVVQALEYYALMFQAGELLFEFLETNSLTEIAKYALAAVVNASKRRL